MDESSTTTDRTPHGPDNVSVSRWFLFYAALLAAAAAALAVLFRGHDGSWAAWKAGFFDQLEATPAGIKLIIFAVYLSLATTFIPLNTKLAVAAVALRSVAVGPDAISTALIVGVVGAAASTIANLNDYHLFTLILRQRRIARVRNTRLYNAGKRWFAKSPFAALLIFNALPVPVDVARMLAATYRYGRVPFAAVNFLGRFIQYSVIAGIIYSLGQTGGLVAVAVLLAITVAMLMLRYVRWIAEKLTRKETVA